jgi:hypothetical protein
MILVIALLGCAGGPAPEPLEPPPVVVTTPPAASDVPADIQKAVAIARAIEKEPTRVDAILQENGTTREAYEALLYDIASDDARSAVYTKALEP